MAPLSESEGVDRAVDEAIELVNQGDAPIVAADYVAEQNELDHRFDDIYQRVQEAVADGE